MAGVRIGPHSGETLGCGGSESPAGHEGTRQGRGHRPCRPGLQPSGPAASAGGAPSTHTWRWKLRRRARGAGVDRARQLIHGWAGTTQARRAARPSPALPPPAAGTRRVRVSPEQTPRLLSAVAGTGWGGRAHAQGAAPAPSSIAGSCAGSRSRLSALGSRNGAPSEVVTPLPHQRLTGLSLPSCR